MRKTGPTNQRIVELVQELKKLSYSEKAGIWKRIALELEKSSRQRRIVNLSRINRHTKDNETIIVPGKVLGAGALDHKVNVAAYTFSESAKQGIDGASGKTMTIKELVSQNPKGKDIRIIG